MADRVIIVKDRNREYRLELLSDGQVKVDDQVVHARAEPGGVVKLGVSPGRLAWTASAGDTRWVFFDGRTYAFEVRRDGERPRRGAHHGTLTPPMPATVRRIAVSTGERVRRGDTLLILEAMKMELPIRATADGVVTAVRCREGELVQPGVSLIDVDES
jgi:acetyl/propionyl-CoA carboxylase alpha subunit